MSYRNTNSPTQRIGQGLLKQRSRRLLDGVLRKRMLVDAIHGYSDELRYNVACRAPNYNTEDLSNALERLKYINHTLMNGNSASDRFVVFQRKGGFASPHFTRPSFPQDRNANYIPTSVVTSSRGQKPPIFVFASPSSNNSHSTSCSNQNAPTTHTKTSARRSISNALSQSLGFMTFADKRPDSLSVNSTNTSHTTQNQSSRIIPISVQTNSPKSNVQHKVTNTTSAKCRSSVYIPLSKPSSSNTHQDFVIQNPTFPTSKNHGTPLTLKDTTAGSKARAKNGGITSLAFQTENANKTSKFRIKKISIASGDSIKSSEKIVSARNDRIEADRTETPSSITINLKSPKLNAKEGTNKLQSFEFPVKHQQKETPSESLKQTIVAEKHTNNDFIKGMTFSASKDKSNPKTSFDMNKPAKVQRYENKTKNKSSHPQGGVMRKRMITLPNGAPNYVNEEDQVESVTSPKLETQKLEIPRFYFPTGKPKSKDELENSIQKISDLCSDYDNGMIPIDDMSLVAKACNVSMYWKGPIFHAATDDPDATEVSESALIRTWKKIAASNHDAPSRFVALLSKPGRNCLDFEDFLPLLKDIVDSHPGLVFLKDAPEFHTRYMNTVIARIFYVINRSWSGQISASELKKSNFLTVLSLLEEEDDINAITDYFSYEHFYVIYCKFWELDSDHDLVIDKHDLIGYGDGVLSSRLIDRVLSGAVTRWDTSDHQLGRMSYVDFVWFILSEEDKRTGTSIEYWYRCMDLDGDGFISMYEMEYFYEEQSQKLEQLDIEPLPFEDGVCQIFDIVNPKHPGKVSLNDLKKCKMAHIFFDTFFNIEKYLNNEQKDPFVAQTSLDGSLITISDWDNFAADEYEALVAEEQSNKLTDLSKALDDENPETLDDRMNNNNSTAFLHQKSLKHAVHKPGSSNDVEYKEISYIEPVSTETGVTFADT